MLAYRFDEKTGEYKGEIEAQTNPLEGGYLCPMNCTFIKIPDYKKNEIPVFIDEKWVIKADYRGNFQIKLDDLSLSEVDYIGNAKEGYRILSNGEYNKYQKDNKAFKIKNGTFVDITNTKEYQDILLERTKISKIEENDTKRDIALNGGVVYKDVLFDSDTDQKVNLLATVSAMDDEQTIVWYGMDNQPLECTKEDLINIGGLITSLHSFCWNKNAEIKNEISNCLTIQEVNAIEIDYTLPEESEAGVKFMTNDEFGINETVDDCRCAEGTEQSSIAQADIESEVE